jgi:dihydroorotate dehydrogenase
MYKWIRSLLFLFPPESVHYFSMSVLKIFSATRPGRYLLRSAFSFNDPAFLTSFAGIPFKNFVGLAAGFDKNARYLQSLETLGFGFVEIGTVTPVGQSGNPRPRLFRIKKDAALINRMGFNNDGADKIAKRLKKWRAKRLESGNGSLIIGGNIGKNKSTPNEEAWKDYLICFEKLFPWVDYFVVNVSSPNTPGLRALQDKDSLRKILKELQLFNKKEAKGKPIFLKIAPDLSIEQLDDVIELAKEISLDGLVVSNTTIAREGLSCSSGEIEKMGAGGLSGMPVQKKSTDMIRYISDKTGHKILLIGSGGIFNSEDACAKKQAGAKLIQVWTGFIYEGPGLVRNILKG